jgi:phage FluMu protein Com
MSDRHTPEGAGCHDLGRCWPGCCDDRTDTRAEDELRCECGCLLARRVAEGIELKCRRCRRVFVVPLTDDTWTRLTLPRTPHDTVRGSPLTGKKYSGRGRPANPRT